MQMHSEVQGFEKTKKRKKKNNFSVKVGEIKN